MNKKKMITSFLLSLMFIFLNFFCYAEHEIIDVTEIDGTSWSKLVNLNIFNKYKSKNGDKIVYPGTYDTYQFTIRNLTTDSIKAFIEIWDENDDRDRMLYRLRDTEGIYYAGNENTWIELGMLNTSNMIKVDNIPIESRKDKKFFFDWKWDYYVNSDEDRIDTSLGIEANYSPIVYTVNMKVIAEQEEEKPEQKPLDGKGSSNFFNKFKTGDYNIAIAILLAIIAFFIILWNLTKKKKNS